MPSSLQPYPRFIAYLLIALYISAQISVGISIGKTDVQLSIADVVLIIIFVPALLLITKSTLKDVFVISLPFSALVLIFLISSIVTHVSIVSWGGIKLIGLYILLSHLICAYLFTHFILQNAKHQERKFNHAHIAFCIGLLIALILFFFLNYDTSYQEMFGVSLSNRMSGMMRNPNAYGFYVSCYVLLALSLLTFTNTVTKNQWLFFLFGALIIVLSGSRGAILAFLMGVIFICILKPRFIFGIGSALVASVLIPVGVTYLIGNIAASLKSHDMVMMKLYRMQPKYLEERILSTGNDYGIMSRLESYQVALNLWWENPILGNGLGFFREHAVKLGLETGHTIHNTSLWLLTETGIFSLAIVAVFFICLFRIFWLNRDHWYCLGMCSILITAAVMSQTSEIMYQRHLWILIGIGLAIAKYKQATKSSHQLAQKN